MIDTQKVTDRRTLHFSSLEEVLQDAERLGGKSPPRASGNWTSAQVVEHVSKLIDCSVNGFSVPKAPLPLRLVVRLLRKRVLTRPLRPGIKLPSSFQALLPAPDVSWDAALNHMRSSVTRARSQRMNHPSPVLGQLTHEQWEQMHCRHAEMHMSFLHPAPVNRAS